MTPEEYVYAVVELIADYDLGDEIMWHRGGGMLVAVDGQGKRLPDARPLIAAVNVSDMFWWATADCEDVTEEDVPVLRATLAEVGGMYGGLLWVARKRGMRPQSAVLNRPRSAELGFPLEQLLAAGPERTRKEEG